MCHWQECGLMDQVQIRIRCRGILLAWPLELRSAVMAASWQGENSLRWFLNLEACLA